MLMSSAM